MKKIIAGTILVALVGVVWYYYSQRVTEPVPAEVGESVESVEVRIGESISAFEVAIVPTELIEDSRCPEDVQCIQAGTVRIRAFLETPTENGEKTFVLGETLEVGGVYVTLDEVLPLPQAEVEVSEAEYVFRFLVERQ